MTQGVQINPPKDDRIERALADPEGYFAEARKRALAEVTQERAEEQQRRARRLGRAGKRA